MSDLDKMHERVLEMQKNMEILPPKEQTAMLGELFKIVSQLEQSLAEIKLDINEIENQTNEEHN
jgi:predicted transcriptional regulator